MTNTLDELRRLLDASTPGPWELYGNSVQRKDWPQDTNQFVVLTTPLPVGIQAGIDHRPDAALIVFLRNHAEDLLAVVTDTEVLLREVRSWAREHHIDSGTDLRVLLDRVEASLARLSPPSEEGS